jgi:hypothetical protein
MLMSVFIDRPEVLKGEGDIKKKHLLRIINICYTFS